MQNTPPDFAETAGPQFPIVGIGASAGGLEAFTSFLKALPADTGMGFVVIQHLAPHHPSMLAEILSRSTSMPVTEVHDEPEIAPNHVYVIPPAREMIITDGRLVLLPEDSPGGPRRSVDSFFRSLAEVQGHRAIAVLLSGTGNDGTLGLEAVKAEGGITFAQDESAQQTGMPRSAIDSGAVDFILPPERIAMELTEISRHPYVVPPAVSAETLSESGINKILQLLQQHTGVDFRYYKSTTLYRRITRRVLLNRLKDVREYETMLKENPAEVQALYQDILISVTSFFRDPSAFEALEREVFPRLFHDRPRDEPTRVWVLGCSSGEEAYSIAIALVEYASKHKHPQAIQIFATDLNEHGIERARAGYYPQRIAQDVSPERLQRYFTRTECGYVIAKSIRELCVFARQNVLSDPPFSRMDLITCRNLLIYLEQSLQRRILPLFHYALKPGGFLWLGTSESLGVMAEEFTVVDSKSKIFAKKSTSAPVGATFPVIAAAWNPGDSERLPRIGVPSRSASEISREADRLALAKYAPASVLLNSRLEVVQYRGNTGPYLVAAPGKPTTDVLKLAREGLLMSLRQALQKVSQEGVAVREEGLQIKADSGFRDVHLEVVPIPDGKEAERHFLVFFEDAQPAAGARALKLPVESAESPGLPTPDESERLVGRLTQELSATREYMHSLVEQKDAANEELQAANEEIQSSNEELQSVNEELQTSKEEIQSSNEELATVNEELRQRNAELDRNINDLANFVAGTTLAVVMVGNDLRIRRFTPQAERQLKLISSDVGRSIEDIKLPFDVPRFEEALNEVIDTVTSKEFEVQDKEGHWYSLRLRPYKTIDRKIDGAVLVLVDIDRQKQTEQHLRTSEERYRMLVEGAEWLAIMALDNGGRVTGWNMGAERVFGYREADIVGQSASRFFIPQDQAAGRLEQELRAAEAGHPRDDDNWLVRQDGTRFWANGTTTALRDEAGNLRGFSKIVRDASERRRQQAALRASEERFRALFDRAMVGIEQLAEDGRILVANRYLCDLLGYTFDELQALNIRDIVHRNDREVVLELTRQLFAGEIEHETLVKRMLRKDGDVVWVMSSSAIVPGEIEGPRCRISVIQDMTALKAAEQALAEADRRKDQYLAMLAHELRNPLAPLRTTLEVLRYEDNLATFQRGRDVMERQVGKLIRLVDDLLDASRITQGKIELKKQLVDLCGIVREAIEETKSDFDGHGNALEAALPDSPVFVEGDPVRMVQIVTNLLGNACRYSDRGRPVSLAVQVELRQAVVRVKDSGIGIAPEMLPRIFELFVQADGSPSRERGGLGIGLSLVKQLVEQHGGRIEARSAGLGQGSEFVVTLPLSRATSYATATETTRGQTDSQPAAASRRVLVIDDNVDAATSLAQLLTMAGHEVRVAHAGPSGLELARQFLPAVVLLDIGLPGMDGYTVAEELRKCPETAGAVLAAVSGYGQEEDRRRAEAAGFDTYLLKPVNYDAIKNVIARAMPGDATNGYEGDR